MRWLTAILVGMMLAACWATVAKATSVRPPRHIPHRVIPMETFAAFPKNWDGEDTTRTAVIRNLDDWNAVFAPAVVMGDERPVAPDAAFFEKESLLAVVQVGPPAPEGKENLSFVGTMPYGSGVTTCLDFFYIYDEPEAEENLLVKSVLLVAIDKSCLPRFDKSINFVREPRVDL